MGRLQGQTQFRSLTELTPQIDISDLRTLPARIVHARWALADIEAFKARFPPLNSELTPFPTFSWEALIRQLEHLCANPRDRDLVRDKLAPIFRLAKYRPPEMVLQDVLLLAWVLMDEAKDAEVAMS